MTRKLRGFFRPAARRGDQHEQSAWGPAETLPADRLAADALAMDEFEADDFASDDFASDDFASEEISERQHAPSLPIILFSAASGVAGAVIALFISYRWLQWGVELSAGLATLALLFSLGISGAILSAATGSRAAPINILFSCGVLLLALFFLALCLLVGALFGMVLVRL